MDRFTIVLAVSGILFDGVPRAGGQAQESRGASRHADSAAASFTRTKLLKTKVGGAFSEARLGDILKELAAQVEIQTGEPVLWAYGAGFPYGKKVTFSVKDKPLEVALDSILTTADAGLGYVVVSKEGDKHDGWVLLTTGGERGSERQPPTPEDESTAAERLTLARKLIDAGKPASAKPLLEIIVKKYGATRAAREAAELLGKIGK